MRPDYCIVNNLLTPEDCQVITKWGKLNTEQALTSGKGLEFAKRRSKVAWIPHGSDLQEIIDKALYAFCDVSEQAFGRTISSIEPIQFTSYNMFDRYGWHMDCTMTGSERLISASIELSDPAEYIGGGLEFYEHPCPIPERAQGRMIMFPSMMLHRARTVYWGERNSLVLWAQ